MAEAPSTVEKASGEAPQSSSPPPKDPEALLRYILKNALEMNASTIHFEPTESELRVRFRILGALFEQSAVPAESRLEFERLVRRASHMDEDDLVHPQEGPFRYQLESGEKVTGHLSVLPTMHGPKQVMTISNGDGLMTLNQIGMSNKQAELVRGMLDDEGSLLLVAAPGRRENLPPFMPSRQTVQTKP